MKYNGYCVLYEPYVISPTNNVYARANCYINNDKKIVPLLWNHNHTNPQMVLGHATLENRPDGIFVYAEVNDPLFELFVNGNPLYFSAYITHVKYESNIIIVNDSVPRFTIGGNIEEVSVVTTSIYSGEDLNKVLVRKEIIK